MDKWIKYMEILVWIQIGQQNRVEMFEVIKLIVEWVRRDALVEWRRLENQ